MLNSLLDTGTSSCYIRPALFRKRGCHHNYRDQGVLVLNQLEQTSDCYTTYVRWSIWSLVLAAYIDINKE